MKHPKLELSRIGQERQLSRQDMLVKVYDLVDAANEPGSSLDSRVRAQNIELPGIRASQKLHQKELAGRLQYPP